MHQLLKVSLFLIFYLLFIKCYLYLLEHLFQNGGPIIGIQIENEYANFGNTKTKSQDYEYMKFLNETWTNLGINSLYFTCDNSLNSHKDHGSLNGTLMAANFYNDPETELNALKRIQPNR